MMLLLFVVLATMSGLVYPNDSKYPDLSGLTLAEVLEKRDWAVIQKKTGYLSTNETEDIVLILQSGQHTFQSCEESSDLLSGAERIILVLTHDGEQPRVSTQNNEFIGRPDEGGMLCYLEPKVSITEKQLIVSYQYSRSFIQYNFEYADGEMILVSAQKSGVSGGVFTSDHFDFRKGVITTETGESHSDSTVREAVSIEFDGFKTLSEFGEMYEWEVAEFKNL